ncbi:MAG: UDP-glucose/GDP-mannose dehydrogenase family protein [Candidatus Cardinium sp.]|nr:UDP-glucose/GDP-mannose dehydrogenase family protein [Candidatus Cardinium sp.]
MHITVVGIGYVGLITAVGLAILGHTVHGVDIDAQKIADLLNGHCPLYEKNVQKKINYLYAKKLLHFGTHYRRNDRIFFLTVGTPASQDGTIDLTPLYAAIDSLIAFVPNGALFLIKSTVPVGTSRKIVHYLKEKNVCHAVISNPEFLREGNALYDFLNPDRIVIGADNIHCTAILTKLYQPLLNKKIPFLLTDPTTAELIKQASNAFLANKIALLNELSDLCVQTKADLGALSLGIGLDKRIGEAYLKGGPGFGGSCLPKDIRSLNRSFHQYGIASHILPAVIAANNYRFAYIVNRITAILGGIKNKIIALYGLTFKADTDDTRGSPSLSIIELLLAQKAIIHGYDPKTKYDLLTYNEKGSIKFFNNPEETLCEAEALIIATEWDIFQNIDFEKIKTKGMLKSNIIIDLRNILNKDLLQQKGFSYYCLGRDI